MEIKTDLIKTLGKKPKSKIVYINFLKKDRTMEKTYDSLNVYLELAQKTINKFSPKFISKEMLSSPDAISDVATAIMYADWRFDPDRTGKTGQKKTLYSYRNQCAIWAIKTYTTNKYKTTKNKKYNNLSLDYDFDNEEGGSLSSTLSDEKSSDPAQIIIKKERDKTLADLIGRLLDSPMLSEKQKDQIKLYYIQNYTLSKIGKKYGVSREAVRQNIKRAIDSIKRYA